MSPLRANLAQAAFTCDLYQQPEAADACRKALDTDRIKRVVSSHLPNGLHDGCSCGWYAELLSVDWMDHIANELAN